MKEESPKIKLTLEVSENLASYIVEFLTETSKKFKNHTPGIFTTFGGKDTYDKEVEAVAELGRRQESFAVTLQEAILSAEKVDAVPARAVLSREVFMPLYYLAPRNYNNGKFTVEDHEKAKMVGLGTFCFHATDTDDLVITDDNGATWHVLKITR